MMPVEVSEHVELAISALIGKWDFRHPPSSIHHRMLSKGWVLLTFLIFCHLGGRLMKVKQDWNSVL
jgi:hypothetical protein